MKRIKDDKFSSDAPRKRYYIRSSVEKLKGRTDIFI